MGGGRGLTRRGREARVARRQNNDQNTREDSELTLADPLQQEDSGSSFPRQGARADLDHSLGESVRLRSAAGHHTARTTFSFGLHVRFSFSLFGSGGGQNPADISCRGASSRQPASPRRKLEVMPDIASAHCTVRVCKVHSLFRYGLVALNPGSF